MGEVFLAEDTELNRQAALKFLPSRYVSDSELKARFVREAQAAARLNHPHIVTIYDVGEFQGRPYFAMEYVEGESLHVYAHDKPLPVDKILELAIQLCDGLAKAHQSGIIHRDIKTANIVVDGDGRARILDFGLAQVEGDSGLTKTGSTLGTVSYMSPEQVRGEHVDQRSDLFSFGVVLYELICGRTPFKRANETSTLQAILTEQPEPLSRYKATVPDEMQRIILKALEKDPSLRYQSASDLLGDLRREKRQMDSGESAVMSAMSIPKKKPWRIVLPVSGLAVIVIVLLILKPWKFEVSSTHEAQAVNNWLAVMYFDNIADPGDSKRLGEISTNLLVTALSQSRNIKVVSTQRLYDLLKQVGKEGTKSIDRATASQVAQKAEAQWMLTGSILQSEPTIVLTSQLIDVSTGGVVASQQISGKSGEDIFAIIDKLSAELKKSNALPSGVNNEAPVFVADVTTHSLEAYKNYLEGMEYMQKYYDREAAQSFRKAIKLDSTFASAYVRLALLTGGKESSEAIGKARKYSDRVTEREQMAIRIEYLRGADSTEAYFRLANEYLQRFPDDKMAYCLLAESYEPYPPKYDSAIVLMRKVLELDPDYKLAYNILAYLYRNSSQFPEAENAINRYIGLAPDEANPYDTRGDIYAKQGKLDLASASYRKALLIKPDSFMSLKKLGDCYLYSGDFMRAESCYQAFASADKANQVEGRISLARIPAYQGKCREALMIFGRCIQANRLDGLPEDNDFSFRTGRATLFVALGECDSALKEMKIALALQPGKNVIHNVAYYCMLCGRRKDAEDVIKKFKEDSVNWGLASLAEYYYTEGLVALAKQEFSQAVDYIKRSDSLQQSSQKRLWLGEAYLGAGNYGEAISILEKATGDYSEERAFLFIRVVEAYYYLGRAYEMTREKTKAIAAYQEYLRLFAHADPELKGPPDAKARLAKLK
jgi:tetratricopeptide (TPR) repeat protein/predicted Ser/Thr protein kinase